MQEVITDAQTGIVTVRDYTPEEIAAVEAQFAASVAERRARMVCSRMQGILALGEDRWAQVLAYRNTATWAEKVIIDDAGQWSRTSENIAFFAYLLNLSDAEVDQLFRDAAAIAP
jgi:hypothetical protein